MEMPRLADSTTESSTYLLPKLFIAGKNANRVDPFSNFTLCRVRWLVYWPQLSG